MLASGMLRAVNTTWRDGRVVRGSTCVVRSMRASWCGSTCSKRTSGRSGSGCACCTASRSQATCSRRSGTAGPDCGRSRRGAATPAPWRHQAPSEGWDGGELATGVGGEVRTSRREIVKLAARRSTQSSADTGTRAIERKGTRKRAPRSYSRVVSSRPSAPKPRGVRRPCHAWRTTAANGARFLST